MKLRKKQDTHLDVIQEEAHWNIFVGWEWWYDELLTTDLPFILRKGELKNFGFFARSKLIGSPVS